MSTATAWEIVRHVNGRPWSRRQIGWYVVTEASDIDHYGEYAADYWTVRIEPGRYPLYAYRDCGQPWHELGCHVPGVLTSGSWWNKRQAGEPETAHINIRPYALARVIVEGEPTPVELLPGVEARRVDFTDCNGVERHTHELDESCGPSYHAGYEDGYEDGSQSPMQPLTRGLRP